MESAIQFSYNWPPLRHLLFDIRKNSNKRPARASQGPERRLCTVHRYIFQGVRFRTYGIYFLHLYVSQTWSLWPCHIAIKLPVYRKIGQAFCAFTVVHDLIPFSFDPTGLFSNNTSRWHWTVNLLINFKLVACVIIGSYGCQKEMVIESPHVSCAQSLLYRFYCCNADYMLDKRIRSYK